jgi:hypothetical protein
MSQIQATYYTILYGIWYYIWLEPPYHELLEYTIAISRSSVLTKIPHIMYMEIREYSIEFHRISRIRSNF